MSEWRVCCILCQFAGEPIGGDCCKAKDTFELCTGDVSNTSALVCVNATTVSLGDDGTVTLGSDERITTDRLAQLRGAPTSVRYAYANYPQCALYNKYKLPAGPFVVKIASSTTSPGDTPPDPHVGVYAGPFDQDRLRTSRSRAVAATPPMGLNSWNGFHCNVDERKMRAMADALVTSGLSKVGYEFVNIE
eukprot:SAG31_NODE_4348_length_3325_cov_1.733416_1_plen_191_part_00